MRFAFAVRTGALRSDAQPLRCSGPPSASAELKRLGQTRFLKPGDSVELEVEGIGVLRNRVAQTR